MVDATRCTGDLFDALQHELARVTGENLELRTKLANVEVALAELRVQRSTPGADRGKVIDLPNPLTRVN